MSSVGDRIKEFRDRDGLRQKALADVLAVSTSMVSRIETGARQVSAFELGLLYERFGWDVRDLLGIDRPKAKIELAARLRAADGHIQHAGERAAQLIEIDALLDDLGVEDRAEGLRLADPLPVPADEKTAVQQGEDAAARVRADAGLHGPVVDLYGLAEDHMGIDVLAQPLAGDCDGLLAVGEKFVLAVLDNAAGVIEARRRFTLAHEIAHAVFNDVRDSIRFEVEGQDELVELRASSFAAGLLMPAADVRAVCGRSPGAVELAHAMFSFRVSWLALKKRLKGLDVILDETVENATSRQIFEWAGRSSDLQVLESHDGDCVVRMPSRIDRRLRNAYQQGRIGAAILGTAFGVDGNQLDELLASMTVKPDVPAPTVLAL